MSIVFALPFVIVIGILVLFMIFYPRFYQKKINKNLEEGKPIRTIEPIYLYGGLLFSVVIIMSIITFSSLKGMEERLTSNFDHKLQSLEFEQQRLLEAFWDLEENTERIIMKDAFIQYIEYEVIEQVEDDRYLTKLSFVLTDHTVGNDVTLKVESNEEVMSYDLDDGLFRQSIDLVLSLHEDYTIYVEIDDGITVTSHDIEVLNLYEYLRDRFTLFVEFDASSHEATVEYYLANQWENSSTDVPSGLLKIREIEVTIIHNDVELVNEHDSTPSMWGSHSEEYVHVYRFDTEESSGTWQVIINVIDEYGIEYTNLLND